MYVVHFITVTIMIGQICTMMHLVNAVIHIYYAIIVLTVTMHFFHCHSISVHAKCFKKQLYIVVLDVASFDQYYFHSKWLFHHSFKDGTAGTLYCQWFAGIYLQIRIVIATSVMWRIATQDIQMISSVTTVIFQWQYFNHTHVPGPSLTGWIHSCLVDWQQS